MKKLLLTLRASVAALGPIMTLVSCGDKTEDKTEEGISKNFKLGKSTYNPVDNSLDFEVLANKDEIEKFKESDVAEVLDLITTELFKAIMRIEDSEKLKATKISISKTIDFKNGKATLGEDRIKIDITKDLYELCRDDLSAFKANFVGEEDKIKKHIFIFKAIMDEKLYDSSDRVCSFGYKVEEGTISDSTLPFITTIDKIIVWNIIKEKQFADLVIDRIARNIVGCIENIEETNGAAEIIKFYSKFKFDDNKKTFVKLEEEFTINVSDLVSNKDISSLTELKSLLNEDDRRLEIRKELIGFIKTQLTKI